MGRTPILRAFFRRFLVWLGDGSTTGDADEEEDDDDNFGGDKAGGEAAARTVPEAATSAWSTSSCRSRAATEPRRDPLGGKSCRNVGYSGRKSRSDTANVAVGGMGSVYECWWWILS